MDYPVKRSISYTLLHTIVVSGIRLSLVIGPRYDLIMSLPIESQLGVPIVEFELSTNSYR